MDGHRSRLATSPDSPAACGLTLAMQMLDHVPGPRDAVRELRRVTRTGEPGGLDAGDPELVFYHSTGASGGARTSR